MDRQPATHHKTLEKALLVATIVNRTRCETPFVRHDENTSYQSLATRCADQGIDLHMTHFANCLGAAEVFAWRWRDRTWQLVDLPVTDVSLCYADLPQNADTAGTLRQALETRPITIVNALSLSDLLTDKVATHDYFEEFVPRTWCADTPDLVARLRSDQLHPDLSFDRLILKPRFGERGRDVFISDLEGLATLAAWRSTGYIVQAFLETCFGIPELGIDGRHDLRLILRNGEIVLAFARTPAPGSFVSNCSQGGREIPLAVDVLPSRVTRFAARVDARLRRFGSRLYSLDLGIGRSGKIWIYELNTMPGIAWDEKVPENRPLHQAMHGILASWLSASRSYTS